MKVAILRPREYLNETLSKLKKEGFDAIGIPFIEIEHLKENLNLNEFDFDALIVTSQTAAKILVNSGFNLKDKEIIAIGKKTAKVFELHGFNTFIPSKFDSKSVYEEFKEKLAKKRVLILRSDKGSDEIFKLKDCCELLEIQLYKIKFKHGYEQKEFIREVYKNKNNYAIVFSSSMIAKSFINLSKKLGFEPESLEQMCIAIGPPTKSVLENNKIKALMPLEYTFDGIIDLLKELKLNKT